MFYVYIKNHQCGIFLLATSFWRTERDGGRPCARLQHRCLRMKWEPNLSGTKKTGPCNTNITCCYCGRLRKPNIGRISHDSSCLARWCLAEPTTVDICCFRTVSLDKTCQHMCVYHKHGFILYIRLTCWPFLEISTLGPAFTSTFCPASGVRADMSNPQRIGCQISLPHFICFPAPFLCSLPLLLDFTFFLHILFHCFPRSFPCSICFMSMSWDRPVMKQRMNEAEDSLKLLWQSQMR